MYSEYATNNGFITLLTLCAEQVQVAPDLVNPEATSKAKILKCELGIDLR